jgi:hypothetical protein
VLPLDSRPAAAAALRRDSSDVSTAGGLVRRSAAGAARLGLLQPLLRNRFAPGDPPDGDPIEHHLAAALGLKKVMVAATVGPPRPNYKPVLQVMTPDGATVGFAKVGWNGLTRSLVDHEATALGGLDRSRLHRVVAPAVLHHGPWRAMVVSVLSPLEPFAGERVERRAPNVDELRELAALDPGGTEPLAAGAYWRRLTARVEAVGAAGGTVLASALRRVEQTAGGMDVTLGRCHGDWTPWNMMPTNDRLLVWDWERTVTDTPGLLDVLHYHFQSAWLRQGAPAPDAMAGAIVQAGTVADSLGCPPEASKPLAAVYLVELSLRYAENALAGTDELRGDRRGAVDELLAQLTGVAT